MDKIIIKDLLVKGILGIYDWERKNPQDIRIDIVLFVDIEHAGETDDIVDCVNYSTVSDEIQAYVKKAQRNTVEALATDICRLCFEDQRVQKVRVRVEKPNAVPSASSVGVEIERSRESMKG